MAVSRSRRGIAVAALTGVAAGYAHVRRVDHYGALVELEDCLREYGVTTRAEAVDLLTEAAALYVDIDPAEASGWWAGAALQLLVDAGADLEAARQIRAAHPVARRGPGG